LRIRKLNLRGFERCPALFVAVMTSWYRAGTSLDVEVSSRFCVNP
jgi:hypothetical protein